MAVEELEESDRERTLLLAQRVESMAAISAGVAHDLMSVLASISMSLDFLGSALAEGDAWIAEALSEGVRRGREGVRQIYWLASARENEPHLYDPLHLVKDARRLMAQAYPRIEVSADYPPEVGLVYGDPALLRQLLIGLCVAACAPHSAGGSLRLRAARVAPGAATAGDPEGPRARFEVESRASVRAPGSGAAPWRDRPTMAALLSAVALGGGTVEEVAPDRPGFLVRIELPIATAPAAAGPGDATSPRGPGAGGEAR